VLEVSDEELAAEALAADPDTVVADDAVPFERPTGRLPDWYMPASGPIRRTTPRVVGVVGIIAALVVVNGAGLCVTYGWPEIAW
jgi:hypothetical protein